jgi:thioredoxin 2
MMAEQTYIVQCKACGAKNRIPSDKSGLKAKCGKCGELMEIQKSTSEQDNKNFRTGNVYLVRCLSCGSKNRIPENKMNETAQCGKCHKPVETSGLLSGRSMMVSDRDFETKVLKSPIPVLFFSFANWCPSCQAIIPVVEELARDWKGRVRVAKLNIDQNPMTAGRFNIMSVPTIIIFDNGQARDRLIGAVPKLQIMQKMAPFI